MTPADFASLRRAMGHTQHSLAVALRMGKHGWQTISGWENGKAPIPGPVSVAMEHLAHCKPLEQNKDVQADDAWACAEENQAAAAVIDRAIADAVEQERARIVEWLRNNRNGPIAEYYGEYFAGVIERGDHKERADG